MDHEIFAWLNSGQEYPEGLLLYDRHCRNVNLGRILRIGGATGKNRLTLAYELGKVISPLIQNLSIKSSDLLDPEEDQAPIRNPAIRVEDLRQQQKMIYKTLDNRIPSATSIFFR